MPAFLERGREEFIGVKGAYSLFNCFHFRVMPPKISYIMEDKRKNYWVPLFYKDLIIECLKSQFSLVALWFFAGKSHLDFKIFMVQSLWQKPYFECFLSVKIIIGTTILALNLYYSRKSIDVYLLEQALLTYLCKHISIV